MQQTLDKKHIKINENIKECLPLGKNVFLLAFCAMFIETLLMHFNASAGLKKEI